jgi:capsular exopolysaccharide synthesis family protein
MGIRRYLLLAWKWAWLIFLFAVVGGGAALIFSYRQVPTYQATTTLLISLADNTSSPSNYNDVLTAERLSKTYAEWLIMRPMLAEVVHRLSLNESPETLAKQMKVQPILNTQLLRLDVEDSSPEKAAAIANELPQVFLDLYKQIQLERTSSSKLKDSIIVIEPAIVPAKPSKPNILLNTVLGLAVGIIIAAGAAASVEYLDDTIRTPQDVQKALGLFTLGSIGLWPKKAAGKQPIAITAPHSTFFEAYSALRTNIQSPAMPKTIGSLLITSAAALEGKSVTAANLAVAMARAGRSVILVDADIRRPNQHSFFGVPISPGLTEVLDDGVCLEDVIQSTPVKNLKLIASGAVSANPAELLGSPKMQELIDGLHRHPDFVIFDSPPMLSAGDAAILAGQVDGVVLVVAAGYTRREAARLALEPLRLLGANVLGVVLNKLSHNETAEFYARPRMQGKISESLPPSVAPTPGRSRRSVPWLNKHGEK